MKTSSLAINLMDSALALLFASVVILGAHRASAENIVDEIQVVRGAVQADRIQMASAIPLAPVDAKSK